MNDIDAREYIKIIFDCYKQRKIEHQLYESNNFATSAIIKAYLRYVEKPEFDIIVDEYKKIYIHNESRVEKNDTLCEKKGLGLVYDYINSFDFDKDDFNLFVTSLRIHSKLYSACPCSSFGGKLRDSTVYLEDTNIEVMDYKSAQRYFNSLILNSDKIFDKYHDNNLLGYIDDCIVQIVDLIKAQPFADGNKRTFRAVLNLLLKRINIPPIYIEKYERDVYKSALIESMKTGDYKSIIYFYYYKICDSIMNLDINNSQVNNSDFQKKY